MKVNVCYKHKNNTDVAFVVRQKYTVNSNDMLLVGDWFNIVNPRNHFLIDQDTIIIKPDQEKDWDEFKLNT